MNGSRPFAAAGLAMAALCTDTTAAGEARKQPTILCLEAGQPRHVAGKNLDRLSLSCLLTTAGRRDTTEWQWRLRRCLSVHGVILLPNCSY